MKTSIFFHVYRGEKFFIAESNDVSIITQALTLDELYENISEAVSLHFEDEVEGYIANPTIIANLEIPLVHA